MARTDQRQPDTLSCAQEASFDDGLASEGAWQETVNLQIELYLHFGLIRSFHTELSSSKLLVIFILKLSKCFICRSDQVLTFPRKP